MHTIDEIACPPPYPQKPLTRWANLTNISGAALTRLSRSTRKWAEWLWPSSGATRGRTGKNRKKWMNRVAANPRLKIRLRALFSPEGGCNVWRQQNVEGR